jgi:hypothetical protein
MGFPQQLHRWISAASELVGQAKVVVVQGGFGLAGQNVTGNPDVPTLRPP